MALIATIAITSMAHGEVGYHETSRIGYLCSPMQTQSGVVVTTDRGNELYLVKDSELKPLVISRGAGMYAQVNAEKTLIGFKSINEEYQQAPALLDVTSGKITLLEDYTEQCGQVSFSNDGTMAYTMGDFLIIRKGENRKSYNLGEYVNIVNISPDGTKAAYSTINGEMYILHLINGYKEFVSGVDNGYNPIWSPDGSKLAVELINGEAKVIETLTKSVFDLGEAGSVKWTSDSKNVVFTRAEYVNELLTKGSAVLQSRYDGTGLTTIIPTDECCPTAVELTADNNVVVTYAMGNKRGLSRVTFSGEKFTMSVPKEVSLMNIPKDKVMKANLGLNIEEKTRLSKIAEKEYFEKKELELKSGKVTKSATPNLIGSFDIPYINQVWDTPSSINGYYEYGYVACAPTSACMNLGYYQLLTKKAVTSRASGVGTVYYSYYVGRNYTSPVTGFAFTKTASYTPSWGSKTKNTVGGAYGYMWGNGAPANMMPAFYKNNGMKASSYSSSWSVFVTQSNSGIPYTICLKNGTSNGHLVLGFRANAKANGTTGAISSCTGSFVCHDPYGDYNGSSYPNWDGRFSTYDWPGYSNGHKNIGTFYWGVVVTPPATDPKLTVSPTSLSFECYQGETPSLKLTVTGTNLSDVITVTSSDPTLFTCDGHTEGAYTIAKTGATVTVKMRDTSVVGTYGSGGTAQNKAFTITLTSGSLTKTVSVKATVKTPLLGTLTEKWSMSDKRGTLTSKGYDAAKIRNFVYNAGKLYCVYNHSEILVLDAQSGESLGTLNLNSVTDKVSTLQFCDVKALDGHIVACNLAASGEEFRLYAWDDDQSEPYLLYSTTNLQGAARLGDCLELSGTFDSDLWVTLGNDDNTDTRIVQFNRKSGSWTAKVTKATTAGTTHLTAGSTVRVYYQVDNGWWIDGKNSNPSWLKYDSTSGTAKRNCYVPADKLMGSSHHEFNFSDKKYAANLIFCGDTNYTQPKMKIIIDESGNYSTTTDVGYYPSDGLSDNVNGNTGACGDCMINTDGETYLEAWVLAYGQGLAYFTYGEVPPYSTDPIGPAKPAIKAAPSSLNMQAFSTGHAETSLSVKGVSLTGNISLSVTGEDAQYFYLSTNTLPADGGNVTVNYDPTAIGNHTAEILLASEGAENVTVSVEGLSKAPTYLDDNITELTEIWKKSGSDAPWFDSSQPYIRSIAFQDGKLYVVVTNTAAYSIKILDAYTGEEKGELNMDGVSEGVFKISSVVAVDGKIFASNAAAASNVFKIYRWDSDTSAPVVALELAANTHCSNAMGGQITFTGELNGGRIWTSDQLTNNMIYFTVSDGEIDPTVNKLPLYKSDGSTAFNLGDGRGAASVVQDVNGNYYISAKDAYPAIFNPSGVMIEQMKAAPCLSNSYGTGLGIIPFGSKRYAAVGTYLSSNVTSAFTFVNITDGLSAAETAIGTYPAAGMGNVANTQRLQSVVWSTREDNQVLDVWFASAIQGLCYYTYNGVRQAEGVEEIEDASEAFRVISDGSTLAVVGVESAQICVYNASGMLVARNAGEQVIDVSFIPSGLY
ncbi:MAG: hypothetical protein ACI30S_10305, partial [Muribaculaceae bacterium]